MHIYIRTARVEYTEIVNESEEVAYEVILINQCRPDHRPQLADMEYNSLLTYPDNIRLLYCDEMYNPDSERKNIEEIIVAKNLLGNLFTANVAVVGNMFANIEHNS